MSSDRLVVDDGDNDNDNQAPPAQLPFPPVTKSHILNCSYHNWRPKYRDIAPKARLIPLPDAFLDYLRADGIILPPDDNDRAADWSDDDSGIFSAAENDADTVEDDDEDDDPSIHWRETHEEIQRAIAELGGSVAPKLNWSAPKDATWINATNSMQCTSPNDVYLLLKSSNFIAHDLQHAFDDTVQDSPSNTSSTSPTIAYHLVLRKWILLNPSLEFRVFVRNQKIIAVCQRDLNFYEFLLPMKDMFLRLIMQLFDDKICSTFPETNYTFDVYIPPPHDRVWLVDFNPWAPRTDPLLFSWMELLGMPDLPGPASDQLDDANNKVAEGEEDAEEDEIEELDYLPELRLVKRDDPEAYSFSTTQYSAHKLPLDVVNAASADGDLKEFANKWEEAKRLAELQQAEDSDTE